MYWPLPIFVWIRTSSSRQDSFFASFSLWAFETSLELQLYFLFVFLFLAWVFVSWFGLFLLCWFWSLGLMGHSMPVCHCVWENDKAKIFPEGFPSDCTLRHFLGLLWFPSHWKIPEEGNYHSFVWKVHQRNRSSCSYYNGTWSQWPWLEKPPRWFGYLEHLQVWWALCQT